MSRRTIRPATPLAPPRPSSVPRLLPRRSAPSLRPRILPALTTFRPPGAAITGGSGQRKRPLPPVMAEPTLPHISTKTRSHPLRPTQPRNRSRPPKAGRTRCGPNRPRRTPLIPRVSVGRHIARLDRTNSTPGQTPASAGSVTVRPRLWMGMPVIRPRTRSAVLRRTSWRRRGPRWPRRMRSWLRKRRGVGRARGSAVVETLVDPAQPRSSGRLRTPTTSRVSSRGRGVGDSARIVQRISRNEVARNRIGEVVGPGGDTAGKSRSAGTSQGVEASRGVGTTAVVVIRPMSVRKSRPIAGRSSVGVGGGADVIVGVRNPEGSRGDRSVPGAGGPRRRRRMFACGCSPIGLGAGPSWRIGWRIGVSLLRWRSGCWIG